jgi:hypothetical protein
MGAALMNWGRAPNIARISAGRAPMSRRLLVTPPANPPGPFLQCVPMSRGRIRVPPHSAANRSATCLVGNDDGARVERTRFFLLSTSNHTLPLRSSSCLALRSASHFVELQAHHQIDVRTPRAHPDSDIVEGFRLGPARLTSVGGVRLQHRQVPAFFAPRMTTER